MVGKEENLVTAYNSISVFVAYVIASSGSGWFQDSLLNEKCCVYRTNSKLVHRSVVVYLIEHTAFYE